MNMVKNIYKKVDKGIHQYYNKRVRTLTLGVTE